MSGHRRQRQSSFATREQGWGQSRGGRGGDLYGQHGHRQNPINTEFNNDESRTTSAHPFGLRGRDIGLFYKARGASRKEQRHHKEKTELGDVKLESSSESNRSTGQDQGNRPPPGLRGKELANFYRQRGQRRRLEQQLANFQLNLDDKFQCKVLGLLNHLENAEAEGRNEPTSINHNFRIDYVRNLVGNSNAGESSVQEINTLESHRNSELDIELSCELLDKKNHNTSYNAMLEFRTKLPAYNLKEHVTDLIQKNQVTVISGQTGSGKTTQIPQFILDRCITDGNGSLCNIICTQPRRISTITVAERVAEERGEQVGGNSIGYSIRFESHLPKRKGGTLTFVVTGVLLQRLRADPLLHGISHIVVDEVHERDTLSDFILVILKDLITKRPDLKVILMSATLNAQKFSEYFGGCTIFEIPGFTFPVTEYYLEDILEETKFKFASQSSIPYRQSFGWRGREKKLQFEQLILPYVDKLRREKSYSAAVICQLSRPESEELNLDLIQATLEHFVATDTTEGAVLIFVPGWSQISDLVKQFESSGKFPRSQFQVFPLHSLMPTATQKEIFKRPPRGIRKVIVATNIAESSITIDDVVCVIDGGRIKLTNFDIALNLETLDIEWVSLANAQQRRGRAGRVRAGICYHLFSRGRQRLLEDFKKPEILRTKLEESILRIKNLKYGNAAAFFRRFLDPPEEKAVTLALERLIKIGALNTAEQLTPLGFHLSALPMDPYTGKMILMAAIFSCVDPIFSCAASLSVRDCFLIPFGQEKKADQIRKEFAGDTRSDHFAVVRAIMGYEEAKKFGDQGNYCYRNFLSLNTLGHLESVKTQFAEHLHGVGFLPTTNVKDPSVNRNSGNDALVKAIICAGLYPNIAFFKTRHVKKTGESFAIGRTPEDGHVSLHPKSVNNKGVVFESPFFVYFQKQRSSSIFLHDSTMITPFPLVFFGGVLDYIEDRGYGSLGVDGTTRFRCTADLYKLFEALRQRLDKFLEYKIQNPGPTHWDALEPRLSDEDLLLKMIRDLLTMEYEDMMTEDEELSDDFNSSPYTRLYK